MSVAMPSTRSKSTKSKKAAPAPDAVALLKADHKEVSGWFKEFEAAKSSSRKLSLAQKNCGALKVHAQIEEEILYPTAREVLKKSYMDLVDEADVEHGSIKELLGQIESSTPEEEHYDAKVKVMGEWVKHHVKEEENELFPKAQDQGRSQSHGRRTCRAQGRAQERTEEARSDPLIPLQVPVILR